MTGSAPQEPGKGEAPKGRSAWTKFHASLSQVRPQRLSETLSRWLNNIRADTVPGVIGAGGLGQLRVLHIGLSYTPKAATVLLAMLGWWRRWTR